jgi:Lipase maturation factor/DCC1-like thiol-disulfide oxidoreductase
LSEFRLVFDGDCGFCRYTVDYARALTGDRVEYRPYQEVFEEYPDLTRSNFEASIWLFGDGSRRHGADAAYRALAIGGRRQLAWAYQHIPGFAALSEWAYSFVSRHRRAFHRISRILVGRELKPARFVATAELGARLIGFTFLLAFWSYAVQVLGLNGSDGILPVHDLLRLAREQLGTSAYWRIPSLFWIDDSDITLQAACWAGVVCGALATLGFMVRSNLAICFVLYLSLQETVRDFMSFQWDIMLLECGFIGILVVGGRPIAIWLARLTVFRFMFMGGMVKLLSGDPSWRNLTALDWHFYTQPLPNLLSWYLQNSPEWIHHFLAGGTLVVELGLPVLIFLPRRPRQIAAFAFIVLQLTIAATGNYNFFNMLTIVMCLFLFDDQAFLGVLPGRLFAWLAARRPAHRAKAGTAAIGTLCAVLIVCGAGLTFSRATLRPYPSFIRPIFALAENFRLVGGYGPFATMTKQRDEIVIEGTADGSSWLAYELPYKPQALDRPPMQVAPHQPRVDWQMWFAALSNFRSETWFQSMAVRLLEGSDDVEALFSVNPFPDQPPLAIRARLYRYRFTTPDERAQTGDWWVREYRGDYMPRLQLRIGKSGAG